MTDITVKPLRWNELEIGKKYQIYTIDNTGDKFKVINYGKVPTLDEGIAKHHKNAGLQIIALKHVLNLHPNKNKKISECGITLSMFDLCMRTYVEI